MLRFVSGRILGHGYGWRPSPLHPRGRVIVDVDGAHHPSPPPPPPSHSRAMCAQSRMLPSVWVGAITNVANVLFNYWSTRPPRSLLPTTHTTHPSTLPAIRPQPKRSIHSPPLLPSLLLPLLRLLSWSGGERRFIWGLGMGFSGAALATSASRLLSFFLLAATELQWLQAPSSPIYLTTRRHPVSPFHPGSTTSPILNTPTSPNSPVCSSFTRRP